MKWSQHWPQCRWRCSKHSKVEECTVSEQVHQQKVDSTVSYSFIFKVRLSILAKKKSCLFVHSHLIGCPHIETTKRTESPKQLKGMVIPNETCLLLKQDQSGMRYGLPRMQNRRCCPSSSWQPRMSHGRKCFQAPGGCVWFDDVSVGLLIHKQQGTLPNLVTW